MGFSLGNAPPQPVPPNRQVPAECMQLQFWAVARASVRKDICNHHLHVSEKEPFAVAFQWIAFIHRDGKILA
jgi:hypothetical protein